MQIARFLLILTLVVFGEQAKSQSASEDLSALDPDNRLWVEQTCPRSYGPSLWTSCVTRAITALRAPGWPAVDELTPDMQEWVMQSCPITYGPQLWRSCAAREVAALTASLPNLADLSTDLVNGSIRLVQEAMDHTSGSPVLSGKWPLWGVPLATLPFKIERPNRPKRRRQETRRQQLFAQQRPRVHRRLLPMGSHPKPHPHSLARH